eukprot:4369273-Pleurochrysis_carterae.AAC.1
MPTHSIEETIQKRKEAESLREWLCNNASPGAWGHARTRVRAVPASLRPRRIPQQRLDSAGCIARTWA